MDEFARAAFLEREAKRLTRRRVFWIHLITWAAVNVFLFVVWAVVGGGFPWYVFPLFGWGVGVVIHGAVVFVLRDPEDIVLEREERRRAQAG